MASSHKIIFFNIRDIMSDRIPFVTQDEDDEFLDDASINQNIHNITAPALVHSKKLVQISLLGWGWGVPPLSRNGNNVRRVEVRSHYKRSGEFVKSYVRYICNDTMVTPRKCNCRNIASFVAPDDCKESQALAARLRFEETMAYHESNYPKVNRG